MKTTNKMAIFLATFSIGTLGIADPIESAYLPIEPIAPDIVKASHKYHGILTSVNDGDHCYFWRDGKKCMLFTNDFIAKWEAAGRSLNKFNRKKHNTSR